MKRTYTITASFTEMERSKRCLTSSSALCLTNSSALLLFGADSPGDPYFTTTWRCPRARRYRASTGCVVWTMGKNISLNLLRKLDAENTRDRERDLEKVKESVR